EIEGRRIHPGATGRVPAENCLDVVDVADGALPNELPRLRESDRAAALAADLHDALVLLCRLDDPETLLDLVGHRFLAIDVLPASQASTTIFRCQWSGTAATTQSISLLSSRSWYVRVVGTVLPVALPMISFASVWRSS